MCELTHTHTHTCTPTHIEIPIFYQNFMFILISQIESKLRLINISQPTNSHFDIVSFEFFCLSDSFENNRVTRMTKRVVPSIKETQRRSVDRKKN